jgi:hypothetical protein
MNWRYHGSSITPEADMDQELIVLGTSAGLTLAAGLVWLVASLWMVLGYRDTFVDALRQIGRHRRRQGMHKTDLMDR